MSTNNATLRTAVQHHQAGELSLAEQIYRQLLQSDPNEAEALHGLGMLANQAGRYQEAADFFSRLIELKPDHPSYHNELGRIHFANKKLPEAAASFRSAAFLKPTFAEAHCNLGIVLRDQGARDDAIASLRRAVELKPDFAGACYHLAAVLQLQGKLEEAAEISCRPIALKSDSAEAHDIFAGAMWQQGKLQEALAAYRRVAELNPDSAESHNNLGTALKGCGQLDEAIVSYRRALELNPEFPDGHNNLGLTLLVQEKVGEASECFRRALSLSPEFTEAHNNLGVALRDLRQLDNAIVSFRRAIDLKPGFAGGHCNLGVALMDQGALDEAIASSRKAIELDADFSEPYVTLGNALWQQGKLEEATKCCLRALELNPDFCEAHNSLANILKDQGKLEEAILSYQKAVGSNPNLVGIHSNLLYTQNYCESVSLASLFESHAEFDERHGIRLRNTFESRQPNDQRNDRLRLGFVSPDLGRHPVGYFLIGVLENLVSEPVDLFVYSDRMKKDDLTLRIQRLSTQWRDSHGISDERLAEQIHADRIDVLFDLAGHTAKNRLLVFARKPAPIQITWAGYVGTTGLEAMDYILGDRFEIPLGADKYYQEKVLRMPDGYICYRPPDVVPTIGPTPFARNGFVTFGCFNNLAKISPRVISIWAKIMQRSPNAKLMMKYRGLEDPQVRQRYFDLFAANGIAAERIELRPPGSYDEYLATYQEVDIALDPFPFTGGATTCESLWMGVPVITCPGETFASRHSLSHLSNVGITETIAGSLDEYVGIAVQLANDLPRLAEVRVGLRDRMAKSPLCDGKRFAKNFLSLLRDVQDQHLRSGRSGVTATMAADAIAPGIWHHHSDNQLAAKPTSQLAAQVNPNESDTLHSQGLIASQMGQHEAAVELFRRAIQMNPNEATFHSHLGKVLVTLKRPPEAVASFRKALTLNPGDVETHWILGNLLRDQGDHEEAIGSYVRAIELKSDFAEAHNSLGIALVQQGHPDEAIARFNLALKLKPKFADAHNNLANVLKGQGQLHDAVVSYRKALELNPDFAIAYENLGGVLIEQRKLAEAIASFRRALELNPNSAETHRNLGVALWKHGLLNEASISCRRSLELNPDYAMAHDNLGCVLLEQEKPAEAIVSFRRALELNPNSAEAHANLGVSFMRQGLLNEANVSNHRALELNPSHAEAHLHLGLTMLQSGNLISGWNEYDWRIKTQSLKVNSSQLFSMQVWDGALLAGRRILVLTEQGLGDTLQFIRYCQLVKERGGYVIVACQPPLMKLLKNVEGIDELVCQPRSASPGLPPFDVYLYLMSLPRVFNTTLETIPSRLPYLRAEPELIERWKKELGPGKELKIGIAWQGSRNAIDRGRSIPLAEFVPLGQIPGVRLISLQKGDGSEQVQELTGRLHVTDFTARMDESTGPFLDTAALMMNLDLVVTSDTSIAHLAGALGVPVLIALKRYPDWRWLLDREDSPWYPTMRLFRQETPGDWAGVFRKIATELRRLRLSEGSPDRALETVLAFRSRE